MKADKVPGKNLPLEGETTDPRSTDSSKVLPPAESGLSGPVPPPPAGAGGEARRDIPAGLSRLGHYELMAEVARGGMGIVYRARDLTLNRCVALKLMLAGQFAGEREVKRFRAEAEAAARLDHPNIVPIYEFGELEGRPFLSMKFVEGANLVNQLHGAPMNAAPLAQLMSKLARAIHYAHQRGVLHRDLKPANVLLDPAGEPHVTDFGLAKCLDRSEGLTLSGAALGSPNYMSPEQAAGHPERLTTSSDIYSLGAIMYELLTGRPPFRADTPLETMRQVMEEPPLAPRFLYKFAERDLETICLKCMEKEPEHRYGSAEALAEDLERWLRHEPIRARPAGAVERVIKWMRRNPKVASLVIVLHCVFLAALGLGIWMSNRIAAAKNEAERANIRLAKDLRDLRWQKLEELATAGKRTDALAYLSRFLRDDPNDQVAATRALSMLSQRNFVLPITQPLGHDGPVNSAAFSADGTQVVTASSDNTARVWDAGSGQVFARFAHPAPVNSAEFVGNTHRVLTLCDDGYARMWEPGTNAMFAIRVTNALPESAKLSPDGKWFAASVDPSTIRVYDAANGQPAGRPIPLRDVRAQLQFSPDSRRLAVRLHSGDAALWKVPSGEPAIGLLHAGAEISIMAFSPSGQQLLIGCRGGRSAVFDTETGELIKALPTQHNDLLSAEFSSDGERLVTIGFSQPIRIRSTRTWQLVCPPFEAASMRVNFRLAPDGKRLVTWFQQGGAHLRDALTGELLAESFEQDGPLMDARFSPDSGLLVSASQDGSAQVWTTRMRQPKEFLLNTSSYVWDAQLSPDSKFIALTENNSARLVDACTGQPVGQPMLHRAVVYVARFALNGKLLATGADDSTARVWSVPGGQPLTPELVHERRVMLLSFSPDSHALVTASDDRTAKLWDASNGKLRFSLAQDSELTDARFSESGEKIVTATAQGTVCVYSARTGALLAGPLRHRGIVWSARFSRDGSRLLCASSDKNARIWNTSTGQLLQSFTNPQTVLGAVFSPDEKYVLTSSLDGMARIWDTTTGEMIAQPMRHAEKVWFALFSPDGRQVATASEDNTSRLWDAATGYPLTEPVEHIGIVRRVQFSADGRQVLSAADLGTETGMIRMWENPSHPPTTPAWFCDLIESLAGRHLNARGQLEPVSRLTVQQLRDKLSNGSETDFYSRWARWFFVERAKDPTPAFTS